MPTDTERNHLQAARGQLGDLDQRVDLALHHRQTTDRPAQCGLVNDRPEPGRIRAREYPLAGDAQADPAFDLLGVRAAATEPDDSAGIRLGLQEPGNELNLVTPDEHA